MRVKINIIIGLLFLSLSAPLIGAANATQTAFGRWNIDGYDIDYPDGNRQPPSTLTNNLYKITYYYLPRESNTGTADGYGWAENYGTSNAPTVLKCTDKSTESVDHAFARALSCEGSGVTRDGTVLNIQTNNSKCSGLVGCFYKLGPNCAKGMGAWQVPLIPYRTIASTNGEHMGEEIYIAAFRGKIMPNGMVHDGYFAIADYCVSCSDMNHLYIFIFDYEHLSLFNSIVKSNKETQGYLTGTEYSVEFPANNCVQSGDCK